MTVSYGLSELPIDINAILVTPDPNPDPANSPVTTGEVAIYTTDVDSGIDFSGAPASSPKQYTVTVYLVTEAGTSKTAGADIFQFTVDITDPCFTATIDTSAVVPLTNVAYTIGATADVQTFTYANVVDGMTAGLCPALVWLITNSDGNAYDTNIFTGDTAAGTLTTYQTDRSYAQTYNIKL